MSRDDSGSTTSATYGQYAAHCLYIVTHSLFNLDTESDAPLPGAVPIHAHEYVHYLHNVSTCAGAHLFLANLWLLRSLPSGTDESGHFRGDEHLADEQRRLVTVVDGWIRALWGGAEWPASEPKLGVIIDWHFGSLRRSSFHVDIMEPILVVEGVAIDVKATDDDGTKANFTINIGYDFISEGVAFEVEREIHIANGATEADVNKRTPSYPYLVYGMLLNHLVGRPTTPRERIDLGVFALLSTSPASTLIEMCTRLGCAVTQCEPNARLNESIADDMVLPFRENAMRFVRQTIDMELSALGTGGPVATGARDVAALFTAGFALRTINPVLEQTFVGIRISVDDFKKIIGSRFLDYCVLQKKTGDGVEYQWIGPGIVGPDTVPIGVFQAAMHFSQLHLRSGKLVSTQNLPATRCPYSGGCQAEIDAGMPEECKSRPWTRFMSVQSGQPICWYAQGVKSLRCLSG